MKILKKVVKKIEKNYWWRAFAIIVTIATIIGFFFLFDSPTINNNYIINNPSSSDNITSGKCGYLKVPNVNYVLNEGSISLWVKIASVENTLNRYVFYMENSYNNPFIELFFTGNDVIKFKIYDLNNKEFVLNGYNKNFINNWTHIVISWSNENIHLYINGKLKDSEKLTDTNFNILVKNEYMGADNKIENCLEGGIDEVGRWKKTLTKREVEQLYNNGNACGYQSKCWNQSYLKYKFNDIISKIGKFLNP